MASSSTSSIQKSFKYEVFLSFRGEDTRKTFVDHLYYALQQKSIQTYKDDEKIEKGKRISDELIKSIEDSKFYIIVFSKNYASSSWCLEELVKIIECQRTSEHTAYPVFYDVEPTEVRKQSGEFGKAFAKQEKEEGARKWREALEEAANLTGWELKNTLDGHEAKFIEKIVEKISLELRSINFCVDEKLIGMEDRVRDIVSTLEISSRDVQMLGIKGMGGCGKTTLARAVFDHISFQFDGSSFVENVRENSNPNLSGLKKLQKQVLTDMSKDLRIKISNVHDGKRMIKKTMCCRKVLLVLDDVDHLEQLKALAGELNWFKEGSRIIITTRDEQVLVAHRVNLIRDANLLSHGEAICLFSRYAFGKESPPQGYKELSGQVVGYAAGLPLTITVLGSFLCGKDELEWKDAIERLKTIPSKETLEILELSYIGLEEDYKEIFLDVACIMKGWRKEVAIRALESCGFHARNGLRVLEQKSLITISKHGCLDMHDRIEEMGQYIVRRKLEEPNKHSRLWIYEEIKDILINDQGINEAIRCIKLSTLDPEIVMKGLGNMKKLRFLQVCHEGVDCINRNWKFDEVRQYFPNALRCLRWAKYPFRSLPKSFQANNLVELQMDHSKIVQLCDGGDRKVLNKLRFLDLSYSNAKHLDLGLAPNLETLYLAGCYDLIELHMPVECSKLIYVDISFSKLMTLDLRGAPNLERLILVDCVDLVELHMPVECPKFIYLNHSNSKLTTLDLRGTQNLERLILLECVDLVQLHMAVEYPKLISLELSHSKLTIPDLRCTPNLGTLSLVECVDLVELHIPVECLKLKFIDINCSKLRTLNLQGPPNLETLNVVKCVDLEELHIPVECLKLKSIYIKGSKLRTLDLRGTLNLKSLNLEECVDLVELHISVECLKLESIDIDDSKLRTLDLRGTPNLKKLNLEECADLVELHIPVECLKLEYIYINHLRLRTLNLRGAPNLKMLSVRRCYDLVELHIHVQCLMLEYIDVMGAKLRTFNLGLTPYLERLSLTECYSLVELHAPIGCLKKLARVDLSGCLKFKSFLCKQIFESPDEAELHLIAESLDMCPLHSKSNFPNFRFTCSYEEHMAPSSIGNLEKLLPIGLCACIDLERFSQDICSLQCLTKLTLEGGIPEAPKDLGRLEYLVELTLSTTKITHLPESICMLKHLEILKLQSCWRLEKLPEDLGGLECLVELSLSATKITHLPDSICTLKHLKVLKLQSCWRLEKLPEDLGGLECLEDLTLSECMVLRDIPNSICNMKRLKYFKLLLCFLVEKLPEGFGCLECLKVLIIEGTGIRHLPEISFG